ncbi:MAG: hypothetical protein AAGI03_00570 [Pseudomonadota bacterium]
MKPDEINGRWVDDIDMHPMTNIEGRRWWAPGEGGTGIWGEFRGIWSTRYGLKPEGLIWFCPEPDHV